VEQHVYDGTYMPTPLHNQSTIAASGRYVRVLGPAATKVNGVRSEEPNDWNDPDPENVGIGPQIPSA
jgi:hypothetical protein